MCSMSDMWPKGIKTHRLRSTGLAELESGKKLHRSPQALSKRILEALLSGLRLVSVLKRQSEFSMGSSISLQNLRCVCVGDSYSSLVIKYHNQTRLIEKRVHPDSWLQRDKSPQWQPVAIMVAGAGSWAITASPVETKQQRADLKRTKGMNSRSPPLSDWLPPARPRL